MSAPNDIPAILEFHDKHPIMDKLFHSSQTMQETQALIDHVGKVEICIGDYLTLLHQAASHNRADLVQFVPQPVRALAVAGGLDVPQPPPRKPVEDGDIVVTSIDAVLGLVASCPRGGAEIPPPPPIPVGEDGKTDARLSRDGTLRWRWEHRADNTRYAIAEYFYEGRWLTAFEQTLIPTAAE